MNFDQAFHTLLGIERGYSNHPNDPGGVIVWLFSSIKGGA